MFIATLSRVKRRLEIPDSFESDDQDITDLIEGVEAEVLRLTGYDLSQQVRTETRREVQLSRAFHLRYRPVSLVSLVRGRCRGDTVWATLKGDLIDAAEGLVALTGETSSIIWPPQFRNAAWFRGRNMIYPVVEVTYTTAGFIPTSEFVDAIVGLCVYRWRRERAGAAMSSSVGGGSSESIMDESVPAWIRTQLAPHVREEMRWCP